MTRLKDTSAHANMWRSRYIDTVDRYGYRSLHECYKEPSVFKRAAWQNILDACDAAHGYTPVVISYNTTCFVTGYIFPDSDTGVAMLRIDTPNHTYVMEY